MRLAHSLRLSVLAFSGYASSCALVRRPTFVIEGAAAAEPAAQAPAVVAASPVTPVLGPFNPGADLHRAGILAEGAEHSGEVTLSFDDGPGTETTAEVLRILAAHGVRATFFLTGGRLAGDHDAALVNREMAHAIAVAGHDVGNHGLEHFAVNKRDRAWNLFQIEESARLIAAATGAPVRYFRPPYGKIGEPARQILSERGDELVMWTIDGLDTHEVHAARIAARIVAQLQFAGQGIVLLHDLRGPSVRALALLLDWLAAHPRDPVAGTGYTVVDLPTYLSHAAARPWPYRTRLDLYHARERWHALGRDTIVASKPSPKPAE